MLIDKGNVKSKRSDRISAARRLWPPAVISLCLYFFLSACATQNIGKLQPSTEITKIFEDHRVLADHLYYYSGLQGVPDAIIGIHPDYQLRIDQWQQVDLTSQDIRKWIFRMSAVQLMRPQGAWILDPDGNQVGIWFSAQRQTAVRLQENNRVVIVPPEPPKLQGIR